MGVHPRYRADLWPCAPSPGKRCSTRPPWRPRSSGITNTFLSNPRPDRGRPSGSAPPRTIEQRLLQFKPTRRDTTAQGQAPDAALGHRGRGRALHPTRSFFCNRKVGCGCRGQVVEKARAERRTDPTATLTNRTARAPSTGSAAGAIRFLVASDVARARASTFPTLSHVFNYDVPSHAEDYVHRIGRHRCARDVRAWRSRSPYPSDEKYLGAIESLIETTIPRTELPCEPGRRTPARRRRQRRARGGIRASSSSSSRSRKRRSGPRENGRSARRSARRTAGRKRRARPHPKQRTHTTPARRTARARTGPGNAAVAAPRDRGGSDRGARGGGPRGRHGRASARLHRDELRGTPRNFARAPRDRGKGSIPPTWPRPAKRPRRSPTRRPLPKRRPKPPSAPPSRTRRRKKVEPETETADTEGADS